MYWLDHKTRSEAIKVAKEYQQKGHRVVIKRVKGVHGDKVYRVVVDG